MYFFIKMKLKFLSNWTSWSLSDGVIKERVISVTTMESWFFYRNGEVGYEKNDGIHLKMEGINTFSILWFYIELNTDNIKCIQFNSVIHSASLQLNLAIFDNLI